jgi:proline iminopeptidase
MTTTSSRVTRTGTVEVPGARLSWVAEGSGPTILCIGSPICYRRYVPQALRDHAEIVFTDVRPWAPTESGFDVDSVTFDTHAADLDAVRRDAGADRVIAMGQSIHGVLAREYASRYPDAVVGVMDLNSLPAVPGAQREDFWEQDASPERKMTHAHNLATRLIENTGDAGEQMAGWFYANGAQHWYDASFDCRPLWEGVAETVNQEQMDRLNGLLEGYETAGSDLPTFLALGRYDYVFPHVIWEPYLERYSDLTRRMYERSSHYPMTEQPEEFVGDVVAWMATLS